MAFRAFLRRISIVGLAVFLPLTSVPLASAHGSDPGLQDTVTGITPAAPGVSFSLVESIVPELTVTNNSGKELEILDHSGNPYLRIGPDGAQGNLNDAELYRSNDPSGTAKVPARTAHPMPAAWTKLNSAPSWAWFDPRVRYDIESPPAEVVTANKPATLVSWQIPLRIGGAPAQVHGAVRFEPADGAATSVMTSPMNPTPGVTAALSPGAYPDLLVSNSTARPLTIMGADGEPFVIIDPSGTKVNLLSPTHVADALARHEKPEFVANPSAPPRWQQASSDTTYSWLEQRARPTDAEHERGEKRPDVEQSLANWRIPATLGATKMDLLGQVRWVPSTTVAPAAVSTDSNTTPLAIAAGIVVLILLGLVLLRRRKSSLKNHALAKD